MQIKLKATTLALAMLTSLSVHAATPKAASPAEAAAYDVQMKLQESYPETKFDSVRPSPMRDVYEVVMGKRIVYTNSDAKLVMFGRIVDLKTQTDLTAARMQQISAIDIKTLPLDQAIKTVKGDGSRVLYVFSDPDCPYCKQLEKTLADVTNVTIYTYLYPLAGLHPEAEAKSKAIWCSKDQAKSWTAWMVDDKKPTGKTDCKNPIQKNITLAQGMSIQGTPFLVRGDGVTRAGALPAAELESYLSGK